MRCPCRRSIRHPLAALLLGLTPLAAIAATIEKPILLYTSVNPPYQAFSAGELHGSSIDTLKCVSQRQGITFDMQITAPLRAMRYLMKQQSDGLFSAMPDAEIEQFAVLSAPLTVEKWYWYALTPESLRHLQSSKLNIAALLGSNPLRWLEQNGLRSNPNVNSQTQLLQVLLHRRADVILSDERTMQKTLEAYPDVRLQRRFARFTPLGVYLARDFLVQHPGFLEDMNHHIGSCVSSTAELTPEERKQLKETVENRARQWLTEPQLTSALRKPRHFTEDQLATLDRDWEGTNGMPSVAHQGLLANPASTRLAELQRDTAPLFSEILLSDSNGFLIAASQATSDFYQGDEMHFSAAIGLPEGKSRIGAIEYDTSTQAFQVKFSLPVFLTGQDKAAGVLTFGVDIATAFAEQFR